MTSDVRRLGCAALWLGATSLASACAGEPDATIEERDGESAMEAEVEVNDEVTVPAYSEEVRTEFTAPEGAPSDARGTLRLLVPVERLGDKPPKLHVRLAGLEPGPHAWHIHGAPCGVEAPVVVPLSATREMEAIHGPLEAGADGMAAAEVAVPPLRELWVEAGAYSVHVHERPGADHGPTVACAAL